MNLRKLLWAFLYTFLILDAVLIYQWFDVNQPLTNPDSSHSVKQEMQMDGIDFGTLSNHPVSGDYLAGDEDSKLVDKKSQLDQDLNVQTSGNTLVVRPKKTIALGDNRRDAIKKIQQLSQKSNLVIKGQDYTYDAFLTDYNEEKINANTGGYTLIFSQKAKGLDGNKIFSTQRGRIQVNVDHNYNLLSYTQTHITNVEKLQDIPSLITEQSAFINAYQYNEIPNNSKLVSSRLCYKTMTVVRGDVIFLPVWTFVIKNSVNELSTVSINAVNGTLIH